MASSDKKGIPFTLSIPAGFTAGTQSGNLTAVDAYTCRVSLSPNMDLNKSKSVHLVSASIPYTQPNISGTTGGAPNAPNNRISITWTGINSGARTDYQLPQGLYGLDDIALALNQIFATAGIITSPSTPAVLLTGIAATQKVLFTVTPSGMSGGVFPASAVIDFLNPGALGSNDSIGPALGFPTIGGSATITLSSGGSSAITTAAPNVADLATTSAYAVYASFATDSYSNGLTGKLVFVFPLGASAPNTIIATEPPLEYRVPTVRSVFSTVDFYFTDQSGNKLILNNFQAPTTLTLFIEF